jgi:hypothetical protein
MAAPDLIGERARESAIAWRQSRAPWRRGSWTPEEVALALYSRRESLRSELGRMPASRGIPATVLDEMVNDAACAVVLKPRAIRDTEHLRRAFWFSIKLLLARYHEGRHRVRVGSRERVDYEAIAEIATASGPGTTETVELKDRLARAGDFMAQLDDLEARVTSHMAIRGVGIKLAARELNLPLNTVKAASHSAQVKLEQVATIAAAGRMCDYRRPAIAAHASNDAPPAQVRAARAHIFACQRCRRSYVQLVREMRGRDFQRRASAAFLPPPAAFAATHSGLLARLAAHVSSHTPGGGFPSGDGPRERAIALLGSGAGAAKAAGVLAGATLIVVTATVPNPANPHHQAGTHHSSHRAKIASLTPEATVTTVAPEPVPTPAPSAPPVQHARQRVRPGAFSYLGGSPSPSTRSDPASPSDEPAAPKAAALNYLGGNRAPGSTATASAARSDSQVEATQGGQFSP